jgi:hypothetical protein
VQQLPQVEEQVLSQEEVEPQPPREEGRSLREAEPLEREEGKGRSRPLQRAP